MWRLEYAETEHVGTETGCETEAAAAAGAVVAANETAGPVLDFDPTRNTVGTKEALAEVIHLASPEQIALANRAVPAAAAVVVVVQVATVPMRHQRSADGDLSPLPSQLQLPLLRRRS